MSRTIVITIANTSTSVNAQNPSLGIRACKVRHNIQQHIPAMNSKMRDSGLMYSRPWTDTSFRENNGTPKLLHAAINTRTEKHETLNFQRQFISNDEISSGNIRQKNASVEMLHETAL